MVVDPLLPFPHQRPDGGRCSIEDINLMFLQISQNLPGFGYVEFLQT